ncbi:MAG TPA: hypothetical protein VF073_07895 [Gaiella sp.]
MKRRNGAPQGEPLAVWALWAVVLAMIFVTYWRLPPDVPSATDDLYHVSGNGTVGGLSRVLVELNFPIALVAILVVLVAMDALPRRAWMLAAPAIALAAVVAWPGVVDQDDLDARVVNAVPALGVALAFGLSLAAGRRTGFGLAGRLPLDPLRIGIAAAVGFLTIPWIAADLGFFLPDGLFIMRRVAPDTDGLPIAAVHLGHHHGLDGALVALSALLLSRPRLRAGATRTMTVALIGLALAYGIVNCVQDAWNEQLVKRGTLDWKIPSAILPSLSWVWLAILVLAAIGVIALRREAPLAYPEPTRETLLGGASRGSPHDER